MGFSKITTLSLTDLFVQQVENMILSGELKVGEKLPAERELSARMGVSRPVISAGLTELEKLGFVEIRPRQGAFVCDYRRKGTIETLIAIMRYNGGIMRHNEVASLLQVRGVLEKLCMQLVIERTTDEELHGMLPFVEAIGAAHTPEDLAEAVFDFHHELAVLSGNMLLPLAARPIEVRRDRTALLDFFRQQSAGDTNASQMLKHVFGLLEKGGNYLSADVLWCTDFRIPLCGVAQRKELVTYRRGGTKFYGLKIGQAFDMGWEEYFDEIVVVDC